MRRTSVPAANDLPGGDVEQGLGILALAGVLVLKHPSMETGIDLEIASAQGGMDFDFWAKSKCVHQHLKARAARFLILDEKKVVIKGVDDLVEKSNDLVDLSGLHGFEHVARIKILIAREKGCTELCHGGLYFTIGIAQKEPSRRVQAFDREIAGLEKDGMNLKLGELLGWFQVAFGRCDQTVEPDGKVGLELQEPLRDDRGASCGRVPVVPKSQGGFIEKLQDGPRTEHVRRREVVKTVTVVKKLQLFNKVVRGGVSCFRGELKGRPETGAQFFFRIAEQGPVRRQHRTILEGIEARIEAGVAVFGNAGDEEEPQTAVPKLQHPKEDVHFLSNALKESWIVGAFGQRRIVFVDQDDERPFLKTAKQIGDVEGGGLIVDAEQTLA